MRRSASAGGWADLYSESIRRSGSRASRRSWARMSRRSGARVSIFTVLRQESHELRWGVLAVACLLTFGSYYIYDFPGSIGTGTGSTVESFFAAHGKTYSQGMNQILYSVYSWPNTVLAMVGGLLIDRFLGLRRAMLLFSSLILAGSVLFYLGVQWTFYPLMVIGRIVFGLGGESLSVSQSAFVSRWFKGARGMALAFGITVSFSRVGSSLNFLFSPLIARQWGADVATLVGVAACVASLLACVVLVFADVYAERIGYVQSSHTVTTTTTTETGEEESDSSMSIADVLNIPRTFWILCAICVFCYAAVFPFVGIGKNFFEVKYDYSASQAAQYLSSFQLTSACVSPVMGFLVDASGRNTLWLMMASAGFIAIHALFMFTQIHGLVLTIIMGCNYSFLVSGLWPSIPLAVPDRFTGFAFGMMTAIQNMGLAIMPMVVGGVLDHFTRHSPLPPNHASSSLSDSGSDGNYSSSSSTGLSRSSFSSGGPSSDGADDALPSLYGYLCTEALFMTLAGVSLLLCVVLFVVDRRSGGVLSASASQRKDLLQVQETAAAFGTHTIPEDQRGLLSATVAEETDAI